ncbi:MAG: hypothetical protein QM790_12905 [Nibricoccus sp.]
MQLPSPAARFVQHLRTVTPLQWLFYALIAVGAALRIFNVIAHNPMDHLWSDPQRHWDHASQPTVPSPMALFDPPVYQTFLSVVQRFTMGIPALVAAVVSVLSLLGPWCWYRFLREMLTSKTAALAGWAAFSLLPTWIGIYSYFMTETLLIPMIGLSLWMTLRAKRRLTLQTFLAMVVVWLFTGLTRGVTIPMAGIACALVWIFHPQKFKTAAYSVSILAVVLVPLAIRNHSFIYLWAPHGNGWLTRIYAESGKREILLHFQRNGARWEYGFTSPMMDEHPFDFTNDWNDSLLGKWRDCPSFLRSDWKSSRTGTVHVSVDFTHGSKDWEESLKQNAVSGSARWKLRAENIVYLLNGNSWPDNNREYFMGWLANLSRWLWIPLSLVVVSVSLVKWRLSIQKPLLPLLITTWFFFQAWMLVSVNEGRYRKPIEGLLVAQALVLIDAWCRNSQKRQNQTAELQANP